VRRRGEEDQSVGALREDLRDPRALRPIAAPLGDVVGLVDDDDVPLGALDVRAELVVLLERVDRDDRLVVVVEGVVVGGDLLADAREAHRVEADEGDREARPQLLLELREHALHRGDEDAPPAPAADELGEEDARFERLAEADGVGDQDAGARLLEASRAGWSWKSITSSAASRPSTGSVAVGGTRGASPRGRGASCGARRSCRRRASSRADRAR
jgi:hypothetical protein